MSRPMTSQSSRSRASGKSLSAGGAQATQTVSSSLDESSASRMRSAARPQSPENAAAACPRKRIRVGTTFALWTRALGKKEENQATAGGRAAEAHGAAQEENSAPSSCDWQVSASRRREILYGQAEV